MRPGFGGTNFEKKLQSLIFDSNIFSAHPILLLNIFIVQSWAFPLLSQFLLFPSGFFVDFESISYFCVCILDWDQRPLFGVS